MLTTRHLIPRRQLSAIMFVDMVGYSALMQGDEDGAYRSRKRYRTALKGATQRCHGEVIQHYGDGALVLFRSAVEATRAGLQIQQELRSSPRVMVRVGIHLADVVRDEEGAYGAGINVAARVEALAVPGSVLISDRVAREIRNHPDVPSRRLGDFELKNIDTPVGIHALDHEDLVVPDVTALRARPLPEPDASGAGETTPSRVCGLPGILYEIHRRRVDQVAVGYLVLAVAAVTLLQLVGADLGLPAWSLKATLVGCVLGLPVALTLAWIFDVTPSGIRRTGSMPCLRRGTGPLATAALLGVSLWAAAGLARNEALATPRGWAPPGAAAAQSVPATIPATDPATDPVANPEDDGHEPAPHRLLRAGGPGHAVPPAPVRTLERSLTAEAASGCSVPADLARLRGA
jgi:class 3 adenylate cyclase